MSRDYQSALNNLKRKIEIIISKYEQASSDNSRLVDELTETKNALENSNNKVKELEQKNKTNFEKEYEKLWTTT